MATAFSPTNSVTTTTAEKFIPEIWSDEIIAAYKKNLVVANAVMKMNFKGKKGDVVHIPAPTRGSASLKAAEVAFTACTDVSGNVIPAVPSMITVMLSPRPLYGRLVR